MDVTLEKGMDVKLFNMVSEFKLTNIENMLIQMFEDTAKSDKTYYIGELNKTDLMF